MENRKRVSDMGILIKFLIFLCFALFQLLDFRKGCKFSLVSKKRGIKLESNFRDKSQFSRPSDTAALYR